MGKFLTKKQANDLKENDWDLVDTESGVAWFGADFNKDWICQVFEALSLEDEESLWRAEGVDFLVIAHRPTKLDVSQLPLEDDSEDKETN